MAEASNTIFNVDLVAPICSLMRPFAVLLVSPIFTSTGGIKTKNEWVHTTNWDCVIFDEYHYGAWNDNAKGLFTELYEEGKDEDLKFVDKIENFDEEIMPITTDAFLYLSGTPFKALSSGEFIEEEIFN
jgi:hypothetical protein